MPWEDAKTHSGLLLRRSCWLTENGCICPYSYGKFRRDKSWQPHPFPNWLSGIARQVESALEKSANYFDCCNANFYEDDEHKLDLHSDNEPMFRQAEAPTSKRNVCIASVSFGQPRLFTIAKKYGTKGDGAETALRDGDLCTMEGLFQDNYVHGISAYDPSLEFEGNSSDSSTGPGRPKIRFNLTFRHLHLHCAKCMAAPVSGQFRCMDKCLAAPVSGQFRCMDKSSN